MRIRKRQVPFPLSSLSPIPLSDLHLNPSPPVLHHHHHVHLQPSDQPKRPPSPIGNSRLVDFSTSDDAEKNKACLELMMMRQYEEDKRERREEKKSNDTKNESILGAQTSTGVLPLSTSSHQVEKWCEGDIAFPLKKRKGSFDSILMEEKEKTKVKKKCVQENDNGKDQEEETNGGIKRGGAIMEGSRCSRVNGRGWRCCQQTLVGYSLCEHHLGKGRLRSMTSVRSRAIAAALKMDNNSIETQSAHKFLNNDDQNGEEEKKPLMVTKKRMKLGMVKARSLSSLLGQTDNAVVAVADNDKIRMIGEAGM